MKKHHICPWQGGPLLAASLRKLIHNPRRIAGPYLSDGMIAMDIGSGMGFFTIPMSEITGKQGKVIAVDLQPQMLAGLQKKAQKAGINNITFHQCGNNSLNVKQWDESVDFVLIMMMLHEVPDAEPAAEVRMNRGSPQVCLIREVYSVLAPGGKLLFSEPVVHVSQSKFEQSRSMIQQAGFSIADEPKIALCRTTVFQTRQ
jgi:ubiquinone/menaquinone biosynthesis C-methylase UbiE